MAFSKAFFVMMSRGRMFWLMRFTTAAPASKQSINFSSLTAAWAELFGRLMPRASIALAMVLAVYIPPQEPGPGMAVAVTPSSSASSILPALCFPTASKTETMSTSSPLWQPGLIVPP